MSFTIPPLGLFFLLRLINVLTIRTFFQPDEYFQSLEPAWALAFGDQSGAWITWEWRHHLRSSLHPFLFASAYKATSAISSTFGVSSHTRSVALLLAPKVLQAFIACLGDFYTYKAARVIYGNQRAARTAAILTALSAWQWFFSARTFSNSLENTLTISALAYWPWVWSQSTVWSNEKSSLRSLDRPRPNLSLILAAFACILRPTNALIWVTLAVPVLKNASPSRRKSFVLSSLSSGIFVLSLSVVVDRVFYGSWTFPPFHFLQFNVVQGLSTFYGVNNWHYYLSQGLPLLLTTYLPLSIWSLISSIKNPFVHPSDSIRFQLSIASLPVILGFSVLAHKEVRFIYPLLPPMIITSVGPTIRFWAYLSSRRNIKLGLISAFILVQSALVYYVTRQHQTGVVEVMDVLRNDYEGLSSGRNMTVGFLMPCHSTPWRSHLVYPNIHAWALTCEPPIDMDRSTRATYLDEADQFYDDPPAFLQQLSTTRGRVWPDYLVIFEQLQRTIEAAASSLAPELGFKYREMSRLHNTHWHDDWRRQGDVIVYMKSGLRN